MNKRWRWLASLALGAAVGIGAWAALKREERALAARFTMAPVVRAKKYVPEGKLLSEEFLELADVPAVYHTPTAVTGFDRLKGPDGRFRFRARVGFLKHEQIAMSKLFEENAIRGLAWTVPPGRRAVAFRFSAEEAVAALVEPGDWVDVFGVTDRQPGWEEPEARVLLSRVQVLAVDDRIFDPVLEVSAKKSEKKMLNDAILVTLSLSSRQAAVAALASEKGALLLALRSPLDETAAARGSARLADLRKGE